MLKTLATLSGMIVLACCTSFAQPADGGMPSRRPMLMHQSMMERLKLTPQQETQMRKLRLEFMKKEIQVRAKIRVARLDVAELFAADQPDRNAIEKAAKAVSDLEYQAKLDRIDHQFAVRGILTAEQLKIWKENIGERGREMFRNRMHPGGPLGMMEQGDADEGEGEPEGQ